MSVALACWSVASAQVSPCRADLVQTDGSFASQAPADSVVGKRIFEAIAKLRQGDPKAAREALQSLEVDSQSVHPDVIFAELLTGAGQPEEAKAVLEKLAVAEPKRLDVYLAFCEIAVREKRWFDAWNLTALAARLSPPPHWKDSFAQQVAVRIQVLRAICDEGRKDLPEARKIYEALLRSQPNSEPALMGLARVLFSLNEPKQSLEHLTALRIVNPKVDPPYIMLGNLYEADGNNEMAGKSFRQALQVASPTDEPKARLTLSRWLVVQNLSEEAATLLKNPIADSVDNEDDRQFLLALVARMDGRIDEARTLLSELQIRKPNVFAVSNQLALVLVESMDESVRAQALQIAEGNVRNSPRSADAWSSLGWIQFRLGDRVSAEASLSNALQLGPASRDTLHYLIELKQAAGDTGAVNLLLESMKTAAGPDFFSHAND